MMSHNIQKMSQLLFLLFLLLLLLLKQLKSLKKVIRKSFIRVYRCQNSGIPVYFIKSMTEKIFQTSNMRTNIHCKTFKTSSIIKSDANWINL